MDFATRKSGIRLAGNLPWGEHFCLFYQEKSDLLDILVPYFRAGLENNEFCVWEVSPPLTAKDAKIALRSAVEHFDKYAKKGQIHIISVGRRGATEKVADAAVSAYVNNALSCGFDGLRFASGAFPEKEGASSKRKKFSCFGADAISRDNAIAAFAYPRNEFDALGLMEVVKKHRLALVRNAGKWEVIESSEARVIKDALRRSEEKLRYVSGNMSEGFAYHRIVQDANGKPVDYVFLEVNEAFEKLTGLKAANIIGKKVTEALPGIEKDPTDWIGRYGKVALSGEPVQFESHAAALDKWYTVSAFSPKKGFFAAIFSDITGRRRAEEALKKSEGKYRWLFDSAGDAVVTIDPEDKITSWNKSAESIFGWAAKEVMGKSLRALIVPKDEVAGRDRIVSDALSGRNVGAFEATRLRKDGTRINMSITTSPIISADGKIVGLSGILRDITERKKAEMALRESEERWATTLASIGDAVIAADVGGRITFMNAVAEALTGWTLEEASKKPVPKVFNIINEHTRAAVADPVTKALREGSVVTLANHTVLIRKDKTEVPIDDSGAPIKDKDGRTIGAVLVFRDVTGRRRAEEELRRSEQRLARSQEMAHLGSWELDLVKNKLTWSDEVFRIFGLRPQEFDATYEAFLSAVHPEDRKAVDDAYSGSLRDGRDIYEIEHRVVRKGTGEIRYVHEKCEHIRDKSGRIIKSIGMVQDITEVRVAEEIIKKSLAEKDLLLKEIHHRVKNNLQLISSLLHLEAMSPRGAGTPEIFRESQNRIKSICLVHEILYSTKDFSAISADSYVRELVKRIADTYDTSKISIKFDISETFFKINTAIPCGLILNELVTNAIKYAFPDRKGTIRVCLCTNGDGNELTVSDDGIGMPRDFDIGNTKSLGLKLVKSLTEQLEGKMEISCKKGTAFKITFPNA